MLGEQIIHHLSPQIRNQQQVITFNYYSAYSRNYSTYIMDTWRHTCNYSQRSSDDLCQNYYIGNRETVGAVRALLANVQVSNTAYIEIKSPHPGVLSARI